MEKIITIVFKKGTRDLHYYSVMFNKEQKRPHQYRTTQEGMLALIELWQEAGYKIKHVEYFEN